MINRGYAYAIRVMGTLEMYWEMESGGLKYQEELKRVLATLRDLASTMGTVGEQMDKKFILGFADALEQANEPGDYVPRGQG